MPGDEYATGESTEDDDASAGRTARSDDFLIPGPTPESNEGLGRWGLSWLIFSIALIVMMALMSYVCWVLALWTGLA